MKEATLIFPDQLFEHHPALHRSRLVYLPEEFLFFRTQTFHKQRLVLLRAAMRGYFDFLNQQGFNVIYINSCDLKNRGDLFLFLAQEGVEKIHLADLTDDWLTRDLEKSAQRFHWTLFYYPSPKFLCTENELRVFFKGKNKFSMNHFYIYQRKKFNILMEDEIPVGGKFSFDNENRKRIPKNLKIHPHYIPRSNAIVEKTIIDVDKEFTNAIGEAKPFLYPVNFNEAKQSLSNFIKYQLKDFGDYEDAIKENESFLFHSVLSPLLNIGLLTPLEVIETSLALYKTFHVPLNSIEGFIRQIIGWREFMRACYLLRGKTQRSSNYFEHKGNLPQSFWNGETGIKPIDATIKRVLQTGYCHHIERLMVLGNFLLLTETDPNLVYEWFMANFIDAYDWVMVPNVYGMSQYTDKGKIITKPYLSGSHYILKMSDYSKDDWTDIWDGLFWRFLFKHKALFEENPRTKVLIKQMEKNISTISKKISEADKWLAFYRS